MKLYDVIINGDKEEKTVSLMFFDQTEDSNDAMEMRVPISFDTAKMLRDYLSRVIESIENA